MITVPPSDDLQLVNVELIKVTPLLMIFNAPPFDSEVVPLYSGLMISM